jgi:O-Antigen ligase
MRRAVLLAAAAVLLVGPTVLAFFSGGYFDGARLVATLVAWAIVLLVALAGPQPLPASGPGRLAIGGLALITVWTGASLAWTPLSDPAADAVVRLLLYLGVLVAAASLFREEAAARAVEPALALGAFVVIGYGLAGRLLPGIVELTESDKAFGRLEQPITYWNAEGALAAVGLVLCARMAATEERRPALRAAAAAAAVPLALGVYLSYSRGAIVAAVVGLVTLLAIDPSRSQLRAAVSALAGGAVASACAAVLPGVASLGGSPEARQAEGAGMLAILVAVMLAAALVQARLARAERRGAVAGGRLAMAPRLPAVAAAVVAVGLAGLVLGALAERGSTGEQSEQRGLARLGSVESRRYDYWRVGLEAYADYPLRGAGAGSFRVEWLRERPVSEGALEIHSLPLEMLTELGIPGLLGLVMLAGGVAVAGRRALGRHPVLAPGPCAACAVWLLHAAIDWDWQLPAATLPAIVAAAALVAASETGTMEPSAGSAA